MQVFVPDGGLNSDTHNFDFLDSDGLGQLTVHRKKCTDGSQVRWIKIQWIKFQQSDPLKMLFKYTTDEDVPFYEVIFEPANRTRGRETNLSRVLLPQLYSQPLPINPAKRKDLWDVLFLVPPVHHRFYKSLCISTDEPLIHPDVDVMEEDATASDLSDADD